MPGYACVGILLEGDTIAKRCGIRPGDIIVAVNGEGMRRFKPDFPSSQLKDITVKTDSAPMSNKIDENYDKTLNLPTGDNYRALLSKIKDIKKAAASGEGPALEVMLERHSWDSRPHAWPRYLTARDGDVPLAMKMHQEHEAWRDETFPMDLTGYKLQKVLEAKAVSEIDVRHGELPPSVYVNFSKLVDLDQHEIPAADVVHAFVLYTEKLLSRGQDPRCTKMSQFIDLTGVGIKSMRTEVLRRVYATFEPNYPETLHRMVMYPVSRTVASAARVMLSFVNAQTRAKFVITDDLQRVCDELGWSKEEVEQCGGIVDFMHKHQANGTKQ